GNRRRPASVKVMPRACRSKRDTPISASSARMRLVTFDWTVLSSPAARVIPPQRATAAKVWRSDNSIAAPFLDRERSHQNSPIASKAAALFYDRLFEIAPEVRQLFPADLSGQKVKLMGILATAINNLHRLDAILPTVRQLGDRHRDYGVSAEHYATVGAALLWTLEQGIGAGFTSEVKAAWYEAYCALAEAMH